MDMMSLRRRVMVNQNKLMTATGNPLTFNTPLTKSLKECVVRFTPKQEGSGTPSPDNVRNIVGRDSVKLWQSGKNLCPAANGNDLLNWVYESQSRKFAFTDLPPDTPMTLSVTVNEALGKSTGRRLYLRGKSTAFIDTGSSSGRLSITVNTDDTGHLHITHNNAALNDADYRDAITDITLEFGSEDTGYEPYSVPNEITFTFPSTVGDNGVVYGGYLDVENGEVVEEYVYRDMTTFSSIKAPSGTSEPWNHRFALQHWANNTVGYDRAAGAQVMCDCIDTADGSGKTNYTGDASTAVWYVYDDTISTVAEFKEKYAGHYVAYRRKVALHEHYSLTPQSIATLRGSNVMWSDANGDITVKYWTR